MTKLRLCPECGGIINPTTQVCQDCGSPPEWGEEEDRAEFNEWFTVYDESYEDYNIELEDSNA